MIKKLLEIRKNLKSRKPNFRRHDSHKKIRVSASWRNPRGRQSKQRLQLKGYARGIATGYGAPKGVYGLSKEGLTQNIVSSVKDLESLNPKVDGLIISRTLGNKKRILIIDEASKKQFTVLNLDVEKFTKSLTAELKEKDSRKKALNKKREDKEKAAKKKASKDVKKSEKADSSKVDKPVAEKPVSSEEKKLAEKKEHDKILTQKGDSQ